jgi:drug/metabolite transporter (DMT)-like permease
MNVLRAVSVKGLLAVVVWGGSFVATRVALEWLHPFSLVAARLAAGVLLLALAVKASGGPLLPARSDWPACTFLGAVLAIHLLGQAYGLLYTSAMNTGWIIGFMPVTIALGAFLLRQQRINGIGWLGVAVGTGGVLLVTLRAPPDFAHARFGDLLQIGSCLTWTVYTLAAVGPNGRNGVLRVTTFGMAIAAVLAALATVVVALLAARVPDAPGALAGPFTLRSLAALAFLGPVCSGVAYYLWFAAQHDHGPARVGSLLYVEPFVALVTGAAMLHETVTINAVGGGLCVLGGVWLVARGSQKPRVATAAPPARD